MSHSKKDDRRCAGGHYVSGLSDSVGRFGFTTGWRRYAKRVSKREMRRESAKIVREAMELLEEEANDWNTYDMYGLLTWDNYQQGWEEDEFREWRGHNGLWNDEDRWLSRFDQEEDHSSWYDSWEGCDWPYDDSLSLYDLIDEKPDLSSFTTEQLIDELALRSVE